MSSHLELMLAFLNRVLAGLEELCSCTRWEQAERLSSHPWAIPVAGVGPWVAVARHTFDQVRNWAMAEMVTQVEKLANDVRGWTPKYGDLVGSPKFNLRVASRYLVGWPTKKQLNEGTGSLYKYLKEAARVYTAIGGAPELSEDALHRDQIVAAQTAFMEGRKAVTDIAAVNVLANMKGKDQLTKAKSFHAKKDFMHPHVWAKLQALG